MFNFMDSIRCISSIDKIASAQNTAVNKSNEIVKTTVKETIKNKNNAHKSKNNYNF